MVRCCGAAGGGRTGGRWEALTFLHHASGHGVLGGVVGRSFAFCLPGVLADGNHLLPLLDGHLGVGVLSHLLHRHRKPGETIESGTVSESESLTCRAADITT